MNLIELHLNDAIAFVNDNLRWRKLVEDRDKWCHILSNDILILDTMSDLPNRKELIIGIQNILHQLDHLFDSDKPPILISGTYKERSYLPTNKDSLFALGTAFQTC